MNLAVDEVGKISISAILNYEDEDEARRRLCWIGILPLEATEEAK